MRFVHTSDWHIGKMLNDYSLLEDQQFFMESFLQDMAKLCPDAIIIAGDVYDRSVPSAEAVQALNQTLSRLVLELKIPVIINSGNHDSRERLAFGSTLLEQTGLTIVGKPTKTVKQITFQDNFGAVHFHILPYIDVYDGKRFYPTEEVKTHDDAFALFSDSIMQTVKSQDRNVFIGHGFFAMTNLNQVIDELQIGGGEMINLNHLDGFDYYALGHIHGARQAGVPHARYSGSPLKYSVKEASHKKEYLLIDLQEKGNCVITPCPITPLRDVVIIEDSFSSIMEKDSPLNDYILVRLTDTKPIHDVMLQLKRLYPHILGVEFIQLHQAIFPQTNQVEKLASKSTYELFAEFYESTNQEPLSEYQQNLVHTLLDKKGGKTE